MKKPKLFDEKYLPPYIGKGETFKDERGMFTPLGILNGSVQCNVSVSKPGTVRGMHWQIKNPQAKVVTCLAGKIHDVCVDLRPNSPNFKTVYTFDLEGGTGDQLFVPKGFAHGFEVVGEKSAMILYFVNQYYDPNDEFGFLADSLPNGIWTEKHTVISEKDSKLVEFQSIQKENLPNE